MADEVTYLELSQSAGARKFYEVAVSGALYTVRQSSKELAQKGAREVDAVRESARGGFYRAHGVRRWVQSGP